MPVSVCVCVCVLRIASTEKTLCFINHVKFIIITFHSMTWHYTAWHHTMSWYTDLTTPCLTSLHPSPQHDNAPWPTLTTPDNAILCCSQWLDTALHPTLTTPDYAMLYSSHWHDTTLHITTQLWLHHSRFHHIPLSMTWCYTRSNPDNTVPGYRTQTTPDHITLHAFPFHGDAPHCTVPHQAGHVITSTTDLRNLLMSSSLAHMAEMTLRSSAPCCTMSR